jgi:acetyl-CoA carboxylase biotin carboxyl carrier protein
MATDRNAADVAFIKSLADLLKDADLHEIEVKREYGESDRLNVRVSKNAPVAAPVQHYAAPPPMMAQAAAPAASAAPAPAADGGDPSKHPGALNSPMVGTCYLAPEPGAAAFVKVGDKVSEGQTVLIIEAMKTMNQIPAPRAGTVKRIVVEDATPVEFGSPLMIIE